MDSTVKVVQLSGILSGSKAEQFKQEAISAINAGASHILVDFRNVTFMDSSGLGALVTALKTVKTVDGKLSLCSVCHEIRMMLEIADVEQFFDFLTTSDHFANRVL